MFLSKNFDLIWEKQTIFYSQFLFKVTTKGLTGEQQEVNACQRVELKRLQSSSSADKRSTRRSKIKSNQWQCLSLWQRAAPLCRWETVQLVDSSCKWWQKPLSERPSLTVMVSPAELCCCRLQLAGSRAASRTQEMWMHAGNKHHGNELTHWRPVTQRSPLA